MSKFLTGTLAKISQNIFAYFSISEHSASISLLQKKKRILVTARGFATPPPVYGPFRNLYCFLPSLVISNINLSFLLEPKIDPLPNDNPKTLITYIWGYIAHYQRTIKKILN